jgi:NTF2-related export protein 1/2
MSSDIKTTINVTAKGPTPPPTIL